MKKKLLPNINIPSYETHAIDKSNPDYYVKIYNAAKLSISIEHYTPAHGGVVCLDEQANEPKEKLGASTFQEFIKTTPQEDLRSETFIVGTPDFYMMQSALLVIEATPEQHDNLMQQFYEKAKEPINDDGYLTIQADPEQVINYALSWNLTHLNQPQRYLLLLSSMDVHNDYTLSYKLHKYMKKTKLGINIAAELSSNGLVLPNPQFTKEEFLKDNASPGHETSAHMIADILDSLSEKNYNMYLEREDLSDKLEQILPKSMVSVEAPKFKI